MEKENQRLLGYIKREIDIDETIGAYIACVIPTIFVTGLILVKLMG